MVITLGLAFYAVAMLALAFVVGKVIKAGNDEDAPANVSRRDWDKVSRFERRDR